MPGCADPTLFEAFYELCADLGIADDPASWSDFFGVLPSNARRYICGTLRPRPERVQVWCETLREKAGHHVSVELPPELDRAYLVFDAPQEGVRKISCWLHEVSDAP
jgi:hypothetical protein